MFAQEVPMEAIRVHSSWASDAVRQYIKHMDQVTSIVPSTLLQAFH